MKRLIDSKFIQKIKSLFTSLWTDDKGNVEIGKNLYVDGEASISGIPICDYDELSLTCLPGHDPALVLGTCFPENDGSDYVVSGFVAGNGWGYIASKAIFSLHDDEFTDGIYISIDDLIANAKRFRHHLRLSGPGVTAVADFYSSQNLVCDSLQDLSTVTHDDAFAISGGEYIEAKKTGGVWQMVKADGTAVNATSVTDAVTVMD